jgi:hypothetical protein
MFFRLLIDLDVLERIDALPSRGRRAIFKHLRFIQEYPGNCRDYTSQEPDGSSLDVYIMKRYHIFYWVDSADRHIKILRIEENE